MFSNFFVYFFGSLVIGFSACYFLMTIKYYLTKLFEVNKIRNLIFEIQEEYNAEIVKLYNQYQEGDIDFGQLEEKEIFTTNLYIKMFNDLEEKFVNQYSKERIRLK